MFTTKHFEKNKDLLSPIVELANLHTVPIHVAVFIDTDKAGAEDYLYNTDN